MGFHMRYLALAVASAAAVAGLAGCSSHAATPLAAPTSAQVGTQPATAPQAGTQTVSAANCGKQYKTWKNGNGKGLVAAVTGVGTAAATGNTQVISVALKKAKPALARAARYPMPACADPKGYWGVLLMHVNAAASAQSESSRRAAIKGLPAVERALKAETKGVS